MDFISLLGGALAGLTCLAMGYLLGHRILCFAGVHRGPYAMSCALLNERRPWCWHVATHCMHCHKMLTQFNLDERQAEVYLRERHSREVYRKS